MISIQRILSHSLRDPATFAMLRNALTNSLAVANPFYRGLAEFASGFYDKYRALPKDGDFEVWLSTTPEHQSEGLRAAFVEIRSLPAEDWTAEYIGDTVSKALKVVAARSAVARLGTMVPDVPVDALDTLAAEVRKIDPLNIVGLKDLADVGRYVFTATTEEKIVPSGLSGLDQVLSGGFRPGELILTMADSGVGKTTSLVNYGAAAALAGSRVLHISFEVSAENTLRRYYRRITETTAPELRREPQLVVDKMGHWLKYAKGSVHVLRLPAYTVGATELVSIVDQFVNMYGRVDQIELDYLDLMVPPKGARSLYEGLGQLSHLVRNIGQDREATSHSATQAGRAAHNARHLRLDMMGDSYQKVQAADIILGVSQTPEEYEANQGRMPILKAREAPGRGIEIPLYVNMDLMMIADLDSANSRRVQRLYKHSNQPVFQATE